MEFIKLSQTNESSPVPCTKPKFVQKTLAMDKRLKDMPADFKNEIGEALRVGARGM